MDNFSTKDHCSSTGSVRPHQDGDRDPLPGSERRGGERRQAVARRPTRVCERHRPGERQPGGRRPGPEGGQTGHGSDRGCQTAACRHHSLSLLCLNENVGVDRLIEQDCFYFLFSYCTLCSVSPKSAPLAGRSWYLFIIFVDGGGMESRVCVACLLA